MAKNDKKEIKQLKESITKVNGIVLFLDALGASNFSIEETINFVAYRNDLVERLVKNTSPFFNIFIEAEKKLTGEPPESAKIALFGDTVALTWKPTKILNDVEYSSPAISHFAIDAISMGLAYNILFRGAIAFGKFLHDKDTVVGPAVADAASWYEKPQMIGAIFTPNAKNSMDKFISESSRISRFILPYNVPLNNGREIITYAVNWPLGYIVPYIEGRSAVPPKEAFLNDLNKLKRPFGTEEKYINSCNFFDYCMDYIENKGFFPHALKTL